MKVFLAHTTPVDEQIYFIIHEMLRSLLVCRGRGAQQSDWRLAGCGQAQCTSRTQCTSRRSFAPLTSTSSDIEHYKSKRCDEGWRVGAAYVVRGHNKHKLYKQEI